METKHLDRVVIRFAGDSGDGMQLTGTEFAKAAAIRPATLGRALQDVAHTPEVAAALFEALETQRMLNSQAKLTLLPSGTQPGLLATILAAEPPAPAVRRG